MPKTSTKAKSTATTPPKAAVNGPLVVYTKLGIMERSTASTHGPLTVTDIQTIMGWETEKDYQARMVKEKGGEPAHWVYGDVFHCTDLAGQKVRCWNNANNRPFDPSWCEEIVSMILRGQWAGPLTVPGETVNGETVRISRYARMLSGQHQCTGAMLADQFLQRARTDGTADEKYPFWKGHEHVCIETIVITGLSEDERILRTIDYVKPRSVADMLFTMELFRGNTPTERKELTRMLSAAIDMLWTRTDTQGYRTHPEVVGFLERHKRLLKCVEHLFRENTVAGGRKISKLRLSAGQCAALCFLMGCCDNKGDEEYGDVYRNESPPSEKNLNWTYWDAACAFWRALADNNQIPQVRRALGQLMDSEATSEDNQGLGGRAQEKLAIIAKAWDQFRDHPDSAGPPFTDDDLADGGSLSLSYSDLDDQGNQLPDGKIKLLDIADFGGIDCPLIISGKRDKSQAPLPLAPSGDEMKQAIQDAQARRAAAKK